MNETIRLTETIEQKREMVGEWIGKIGERQRVDEMPINILRDVLTSYGANFENLSDESRKGLSKYSEKSKAEGVKNVWGENFVIDYKQWVNEYIENYEKTGKILPLVYKKNEDPLALKARKNSGMHQFLYELTSFASGGFNFEKYKTYTEIRVGNGLLFEIDKKKERKKIITPTSDGKEILIGSYPPDFPVKAWGWITKTD